MDTSIHDRRSAGHRLTWRCRQASVLTGDALKSTLQASEPFVVARVSGDARIRWAIKENGCLHGVNQVNGGTDRGQWRIESDRVRLTWFGSSRNGCLGMTMDGGDLILFSGCKDAPRPLAKVIRE